METLNTAKLIDKTERDATKYAIRALITDNPIERRELLQKKAKAKKFAEVLRSLDSNYERAAYGYFEK